MSSEPVFVLPEGDVAVAEAEETLQGNAISCSDFIFRKIGSSIPLRSSDSGFDLSTVPAQALAVSERFGVAFIASLEGFCVAKTKDAVALAKHIKESGKHISIQSISVLNVSIGQVSILSLSTDSSTLAACVGGEIKLFSVASLLSEEHEPISSCSLGAIGQVKVFSWRKNSDDCFVVLSPNGELCSGKIGDPLKKMMDKVDAVDWSVQGHYIVVARNHTLCFLTSGLIELVRTPLSFTKCICETDTHYNIKVDTVKWVRPDSIVIGCIQLTNDGDEESYLVVVINSGASEFIEASCKPTIHFFSELFTCFMGNVLSGVGAYLYMCYLDCWELAVAANRKDTDAHIVSIGWSFGEKNGEAVAVEFRQDRDVPRIELAENGEENLLVGFGVDKISVCETIEFLGSDEECKELLPYCILMCVTSDGKLVMFYVARVSDLATRTPAVSVCSSDVEHERISASRDLSMGGDRNEIERLNNCEVESKLDFQFKQMDLMVQKRKDNALTIMRNNSQVMEMREHEKDSHLQCPDPLNFSVALVVSSASETASPLARVAVGGSTGHLAQDITGGVPAAGQLIPHYVSGSRVNEVPGSSGSQKISKELKATGTTCFLSNNDTSFSPSISCVLAQAEATSTMQSSSEDILGNKVGWPFTGVDTRHVQHVPSDSSSIVSLSSSNNLYTGLASATSCRTGDKGGLENVDNGCLSKSNVLASGNKILDAACTRSTNSAAVISLKSTQEEKQKSDVTGVGKAYFIPRFCVMPSSKDYMSDGSFPHMRYNMQRPSNQSEISQKNFSASDMVRQLDDLLAHIEKEGGFRDACTFLLKNAVAELEVDLDLLSARYGAWKSTLEEQQRDVEYLQNKMAYVLAKKFYVDGLLKQLSDKKYWELWDRQNLSTQFEMKQLQIEKLHQTLVSQVIELDKHFNILDIKGFGISENIPTHSRVSCHNVEYLREIQSFKSLCSTINLQLATAEKLSDCLSKQMALLNVGAAKFQKQNVKKKLFESIGLAYDHDGFQSPAIRCGSSPDSTRKHTFSSQGTITNSFGASASGPLKRHDHLTSRRRESPDVKCWTVFGPHKMTVKRLPEVEHPICGINQSNFKINEGSPFKWASRHLDPWSEIIDAQIQKPVQLLFSPFVACNERSNLESARPKSYFCTGYATSAVEMKSNMQFEDSMAGDKLWEVSGAALMPTVPDVRLQTEVSDLKDGHGVQISEFVPSHVHDENIIPASKVPPDTTVPAITYSSFAQSVASSFSLSGSLSLAPASPSLSPLSSVALGHHSSFSKPSSNISQETSLSIPILSASLPSLSLQPSHFQSSSSMLPSPSSSSSQACHHFLQSVGAPAEFQAEAELVITALKGEHVASKQAPAVISQPETSSVKAHQTFATAYDIFLDSLQGKGYTEVVPATSIPISVMDAKNHSNSAISEEDEMEEEASEAIVGLGLDDFGRSSVPEPDAIKHSARATASLGPPSLTVASGEFFRPASFGFQSLSPPQPSQMMNQFVFSGGFDASVAVTSSGSGFGQPAQLGPGQQALGSVLGAFGHSRQLGSGPLATGSSHSNSFGSGFASAATGGGFANLASTGGGFAALASFGGNGGGFAAATSPLGFTAAASSPAVGGFTAFSSHPGVGGFSSFSGGINMTAGKPSELFTHMRK